MCSHYQALTDRTAYLRCFGAAPVATDFTVAVDLWPGTMGYFIRRCASTTNAGGNGSGCEVLAGIFGLIPEWTQDLGIARHTFNAPIETVSQSQSFRGAWSQARHCIIAASAIFEPNCQGAKAIATRIVQADAEPLGIAGLWSACQLPQQTIYSYTLLTMKADAHALMRQFRQSTAEKRMLVVLPKERYMDWLNAPHEASMAFMQPYAAQNFRVEIETNEGEK
jgi:putative SOS response-associated peptidase YedK